MSVSTDTTPAGGPSPKQSRWSRRPIVLAAAGLVVLVLGFALAAVIAQRRVNHKERADLLSDQPQVSGGNVDAVGPLNGTDLLVYVSGRQTALQKATGSRVAVVSFPSYKTPAEARALAGNVDVIALLAAPPGGAPSTVTGDIGQWAQQAKAQATADRDQTQQMLNNGVDDPEFKSFYQSEVARLSRLIATIKPDGPIVFGVVVRGPASELQALGSRPGIRLVDVAASDKVTDKTEYRGIRPEEVSKSSQTAPRPT